MTARLATLSALALPATSLRLAHPRPRYVAARAPLVTSSLPHLRLFRVRSYGDEHISHMGDPERRAVDKSEWIEAEAYGPVSAYCSAAPLAAATPDTPLGEIMHHFEEFTGRPRASCDACPASPLRSDRGRVANTGLPVLDEHGCPVGVVSEKDVSAYLQQYGDDTSRLYSMPVAAVMSTPAVTIRSTARIAYAAGLMLQQCVGLAARAGIRSLTNSAQSCAPLARGR